MSIGSCSLGAAQFALERAITYTKERRQFGKPISDFQNTQVSCIYMHACQYDILTSAIPMITNIYVCVCDSLS